MQQSVKFGNESNAFTIDLNPSDLSIYQHVYIFKLRTHFKLLFVSMNLETKLFYILQFKSSFSEVF